MLPDSYGVASRSLEREGANAGCGDLAPARDSVAALIVTYNPDTGLTDRVRPLIGQVGAIVIVDNGSSEVELEGVERLAHAGVAVLIRNARNRGLAAALNQGVGWAHSHGFAWALTLDQDTVPGPDVVAAAGRVFLACRATRPAVIGSEWTSHERTRSHEMLGHAATAVITAGSLHSTAAWAVLGQFREDFFIDYIDVEYCLRARRKGWAILQSSERTIDHHIGRPVRHGTRLRGFTTTNHDRVRRYYITRNRISVWRTYWRSERRYVTSDMAAAAKELIKLVLFETDRPGKFRALARGIIDAVRGVSGPAPQRLHLG